MEAQHNQSGEPSLPSDEPSEFEYIYRQFSNRSHEEVCQAIKAARAELKEPEDRERIMQILRKRLGPKSEPV